MTFLAPLLLLGTLAIASPIIIHLLARRQVKRVPWAAMRFLQKAVERHQRRMNLEEIILMCLRCTLLLLLAIALARPALRKGSSIGFRGRDEVAIILMDASLSMAQTDGVTSLFERAQQAAEYILDAFPTGAPVAIWLVTDSVNRLTPEPTKDTALNRKLIRDSLRTDRSADWPSALRTALEKLSSQSASVKQLFIVTDGQAHGWKVPAEAVSLIKENGKGVLVNIVFAGDPDPRNITVTDVRLATALSVVNEPLQLEAELTNFGPDEVLKASITVSIDNGSAADERVIDFIKPGGVTRVTLQASVPEPGIHTFTIRYTGDHCPADDSRTIALRVLDEINVLLVDGEPGAEPRDSEVFYLRHALAPVSAEMRERYSIKPRVVTEADLSSISFATFDAIILANVVDLSVPTADALVSYVNRGGGLMIFPGSRTNATFYNEKLLRDSSLLPAAFGEIRGSANEPKRATSLQARDYAHPMVSLWNDPAAGSLATAQFFRAFKLAPGPPDSKRQAGPSVVVLHYEDGEPAVVEQTFGAGRVLQFSSTADSAWNDFCVRPLFVPLIHRALGALIGRHNERLNLAAGQIFTHEIPIEFAEKSARVTRSGESLDQSVPAPIHLRDGTPALSFTQTERSGGYEIHIGDDATPALRFATQSEPIESKLDPLTSADVKTLQSVAQVTHSTTGSGLRDTLLEQRNGAEFWLPLAWLALGVALTETVLGNLWSRPK